MTEPMEAKRCPTCGGENGHRLGCDFGLSDPPPAPVDEGERCETCRRRPEEGAGIVEIGGRLVACPDPFHSPRPATYRDPDEAAAVIAYLNERRQEWQERAADAESALAQVKLAVHECDTAAEKLDHPDEDRIVQYRLNTGPWHRLLALTGPGPHEKSMGDLWQERAMEAERELDRLRSPASSLDQALRDVEATEDAYDQMKADCVAEGDRAEAAEHRAQQAIEGLKLVLRYRAVDEARRALRDLGEDKP